MKKVLFFLFSCSVFVFNACNSKQEQVTESSTADSTTVDSTELAAPKLIELSTKTGIVIKIEETHPMGESLSNISIKTTAKDTSTIYLNDVDPIMDYKLYDLDGNGFEELYLFTQAAGSGSYGNIIAYASNKDLSFTPITLEEENKKFPTAFQSYQGHDEYRFENKILIRTFPEYIESDSLQKTSGKQKNIFYELVQGEASWRLIIKNVN